MTISGGGNASVIGLRPGRCSFPREREKVLVGEQLDVFDLGEPRVLHPARQLLARDLELRLRAVGSPATFVVDDDDAARAAEIRGERLEISGAILDVMDDVVKEGDVDRLDG